MSGKTAAPWEIPFPQAADEVKPYPSAVGQPLAERIANIFKERLLTIATHATSFTAATGELAKATGALTVTLPAVAENATVGVLANNHTVKIKTVSAAKIFGGFIEGLEEINLVGYQYVVLVSDGASWFIVAGEPTRVAAYSALITRAAATAFTPSTTREALVIIKVHNEGGSTGARVFCQGIEIAEVETPIAVTQTSSFICPAGTSWEWLKISGAGTTEVKSSYLIR